MRNKSCKNGFTLIELLVVIAIIAILAAILFPVFVRAKENANRGKCQSHEKQLIAALQAYTDDYNGRLPRMQFLTDRSGFSLYKPYVKNFDILLCSGTIKRNTRLGEFVKPSYTYNQHCLCVPLSMMMKENIPQTDVYSADISKVGNDVAKWPGRPLSDVRIHSKCPAFFCAEALHFSADGVPNGWGWEPEDILDSRMSNPHLEGSNYAFLDGHVQCLLPNGLTGNKYFYQATIGIDYDGNGSVGDRNWMR